MTHVEFHRAVRAIANGRYCTSQIAVSEHRDGHIKIQYAAYIEGVGWCGLGLEEQSPLEVLAELRSRDASPPVTDDRDTLIDELGGLPS